MTTSVRGTGSSQCLQCSTVRSHSCSQSFLFEAAITRRIFLGGMRRPTSSTDFSTECLPKLYFKANAFNQLVGILPTLDTCVTQPRSRSGQQCRGGQPATNDGDDQRRQEAEAPWTTAQAMWLNSVLLQHGSRWQLMRRCESRGQQCRIAAQRSFRQFPVIAISSNDCRHLQCNDLAPTGTHNTRMGTATTVKQVSNMQQTLITMLCALIYPTRHVVRFDSHVGYMCMLIHWKHELEHTLFNGG